MIRRLIKNLRWWLWARRLERLNRAFKRDTADLRAKLDELLAAEKATRQ